MQIAQVMAGYSLGEADLLRRAMGKKDKAEMARQQARFVEGALKNGVAKKDAVYIFELVDKFAGYGFNKSHAAAYALVSYHTAYLKANFREEFLAASMTLDMANTDKLAVFAAEARRSGIAVKPPCLNASGVDFLPEPSLADGQPGAIRYSLAALKNIGSGAVESIVGIRDAGGRFKSLGDFASRLNVKALNKRALETLAAAGAFDALEADRALAHGNVDQVMALAQRLASDAASGISDLFGGGATSAPQLDLRPVRAWTPMERLEKEFDAIGFFLSGHPLDEYESVLTTLGVQSWTDFEAATERGASAGRLAGVVVSARERKSQKGNKFAFAMFSDASGQFEAVIFSDTLAQSRDLLEPGTPVLITVEAEREGDTVKMRVQGMEALDKAAGAVQRGLKLVLAPNAVLTRRADIAGIRELLKPGRGEIRLVLKLDEKGREVELAVPGRYEVGPMLRGTLSTVPGVLEVIEL